MSDQADTPQPSPPTTPLKRLTIVIETMSSAAIKSIADGWEAFGATLGVPSAELDAIRKVDTTYEYLNRVIAVVEVWIGAKGDFATVGNLCQTLTELGHNMAAESIANEIATPKSRIVLEDGSGRNEPIEGLWWRVPSPVVDGPYPDEINKIQSFFGQSKQGIILKVAILSGSDSAGISQLGIRYAQSLYSSYHASCIWFEGKEVDNLEKQFSNEGNGTVVSALVLRHHISMVIIDDVVEAGGNYDPILKLLGSLKHEDFEPPAGIVPCVLIVTGSPAKVLDVLQTSDMASLLSITTVEITKKAKTQKGAVVLEAFADEDMEVYRKKEETGEVEGPMGKFASIKRIFKKGESEKKKDGSKKKGKDKKEPSEDDKSEESKDKKKKSKFPWSSKKEGNGDPAEGKVGEKAGEALDKDSGTTQEGTSENKDSKKKAKEKTTTNSNLSELEAIQEKDKNQNDGDATNSKGDEVCADEDSSTDDEEEDEEAGVDVVPDDETSKPGLASLASTPEIALGPNAQALVAKFIVSFDTALATVPANISTILRRTMLNIVAAMEDDEAHKEKTLQIGLKVLALIRYFIAPGESIARKKLIALIKCLTAIEDDNTVAKVTNAVLGKAGSMLSEIEGKGSKPSYALHEPSTIDAIDQLLKSPAMEKHMGGKTNLAQLQDDVLSAVVKALHEEELRKTKEEENQPLVPIANPLTKKGKGDPLPLPKVNKDKKSFGKKLSAHISHLVKGTLWQLQQAPIKRRHKNIIQLIGFCDKGVLAIAEHRYKDSHMITEAEKKYITRKRDQQDTNWKMLGIAAIGVASVATVAAVAIAVPKGD